MKTIPEILKTTKTIAVVGMSNKPERASHQVAEYLQQHGYRIVPVNPSYAGQQILGEHVYASVPEAAAAIAPVRIDLVDCFRKSEDIVPIARDAVAIGAACLWMQLDVVNEEAARIAKTAGLDVVMDHCVKIEHKAVSA
ncbi:CoA-binding protein [Massilia glaciei]|uniref:CoA-binding protein n=1 Tax=Massilia glaciei TaxID=1524097 RepID=A0A2U2I728_9BURK|nr:CoA-binding protein [Massilia glaciei]PWF55557.1 CoA-binding protein [Massilia glaciei]